MPCPCILACPNGHQVCKLALLTRSPAKIAHEDIIIHTAGSQAYSHNIYRINAPSHYALITTASLKELSLSLNWSRTRQWMSSSASHQGVRGSRPTKRAAESSNEGDGRDDSKKRSTARRHAARAPPPEQCEHECYLCLEVAGRPTRSGDRKLLHTGCGCRGSAGRAHLPCLVRAAEHNPYSWVKCSTCKHDFTGETQLELAQKRCGRARSRLPDALGHPALPEPLALGHLASALTGAGRFEEALPVREEVLALCEQTFGPDHLHTLTAVSHLAILLIKQGDRTTAEPLKRRILETIERTLGPEHPSMINAVGNLAGLLHQMGDLTAAEPLMRRVLEVRETTLGPEHPYTIIAVLYLGTLLH